MTSVETAQPKKWGGTILVMGATWIGAEVVGTLATHRTTLSPPWKGALRALVALIVAWLVRKKAPAVSLGLGVYALGTAVRGGLESWELDRYLSRTDMARQQQIQQLGAQPATQGQQPAPQGQQQPGTRPPGSGPEQLGAPVEGTVEYYRQQGYVAA